MPNELYIYTTPPEAAVTVTLDSGITVQGSDPMTANGRSDAHLVDLPEDTPAQGSAMRVDGGAAYVPFDARGLIVPSASGEAKFQLDDIHLQPMPGGGTDTGGGGGGQPAPIPSDPWGIIQWTFANGRFDLRTKQGCGEFTEACALNLYTYNFPLWGHVVKNPGQNQWNGHAVDAVHCLGGPDTGIWDIIFSSESPEAHPVYNYAGPADPAIWAPPVSAPSRMLLAPISRVGVRHGMRAGE